MFNILNATGEMDCNCIIHAEKMIIILKEMFEMGLDRLILL